MTKMAATKPDTTASDTIDELFVIGFDKAGKPQGARFKKCDDRVVSAAFDLMLTAVYPASTAFAEIGMKLPQGRLYDSGKTFIPNIRRDLHDKLIAVLATPGDTSSAHRLEKSPEDQAPLVAPAIENCVSLTVSGLPRSWDTIGVGQMVLVHASLEDGWWESVITAREGDVLTLRYRDYPKEPEMVRHISTIALVNPGSL